LGALETFQVSNIQRCYTKTGSDVLIGVSEDASSLSIRLVDLDLGRVRLRLRRLFDLLRVDLLLLLLRALLVSASSSIKSYASPADRRVRDFERERLRVRPKRVLLSELLSCLLDASRRKKMRSTNAQRHKATKITTAFTTF
jgi:hypothetical protein